MMATQENPKNTGDQVHSPSTLPEKTTPDGGKQSKKDWVIIDFIKLQGFERVSAFTFYVLMDEPKLEKL